jgi:hypothetical protein
MLRRMTAPKGMNATGSGGQNSQETCNSGLPTQQSRENLFTGHIQGMPCRQTTQHIAIQA